MPRKRKTVKTTLLIKGHISEYQSVLEGTVGDLLSSLGCYDPNDDRESEVDGQYVNSEGAFFNPDCDYEIIIRPKK